MNKVSLYGPLLPSVSFLIFNDSNELIETLVSVQNVHDVWEGTIPGSVPEGIYTIIGISSGNVLGKEIIYWNGTKVISDPQQLLEIYEIYGLNQLHPLSVSFTERKTGTGSKITQSIVSNAGVTTVTRVPG